jgi:hypothetical protein
MWFFVMEAMDGYMEIFLCEQDHPAPEPVTCRSVRNFPCKQIALKKRLKKVIIEVS